MTCVELTTDTPEEMINLLRGLKLERTKDEPMPDVRFKEKVHDNATDQLQAEEGMGEAPKKAAPDEDYIETLADALEELSNEQTAENRMTIIQAAKALRLFRDYMVASMSKNVDLALEAIKICRKALKENFK